MTFVAVANLHDLEVGDIMLVDELREPAASSASMMTMSGRSTTPAPTKVSLCTRALSKTMTRWSAARTRHATT
jgi:hypothetical protein